MDNKKRKYSRKCGVCGVRHDQCEMIRDDCSPNGWICFECHRDLNPEYYDFGELNELKPCSCGCKRLWVVNNRSFLKNRFYIECTNCWRRTKSFKKQVQSVEAWNNEQIAIWNKENIMKIELGKIVKDTVTNFQGVVTARAEYLYDNPKVLVEWIDATGRPIEWWLDEKRVQVV